MSHPVMMPSPVPRRNVARSGRRAALALVTHVLRWLPPSSLVLVAALAVGVPSRARAEPPASRAADSEESATLPRQFSVEVISGGVLFSDGTRLGAGSELERWAQRAFASSRFAGAVVFGDEQHDAAAITSAMDLLRRVGFEVRRAGRPAPTEVSAARTPGLTPLVSAGRAPPVVRAAPPAAPRAPRAPAVVLASVGLHVDGALNREPHRGRLVRVFEREFSAFRRCHERAEKHAQGASFGVDLAIPKAGGRARVRQTRTRLTSKPFQACMHGVFEAIQFAPPPSGRDEIVSYSVLFKPGGP